MGKKRPKKTTSRSNNSGNSNTYVIAGAIVLAGIIIGGAVFLTSTPGTTLPPSGNNGNGGGGHGNDATVSMKALLESESAATLGNEDAPVVLIEFSDYECPFCRQWSNQSKAQLEAEYIDTGKVLFVFKDFPLTRIHPFAVTAAHSARCAGEQGKYWEMHDAIFDLFGQNNFSQETVEQTAQDLELNVADFQACNESAKFLSNIQQNFDEGASNGITGTPGFLIGTPNGTARLISGAQPYSVFKQAIDSLLA